MRGHAEFDEFADNYDDALHRGISISGEDKNFFARGRIAWLAESLRLRGIKPKNAFDYGCGTGSAAPFLLDLLALESVVGVDISSRSVEVANRKLGSDRARFLTLDEHRPDEQFDLAFCNGVFHHIPLDQRAGAVDYVYRSLRPGGYWAFWENNPWNPGTQWVIYRLPFEKDSITVSSRQARQLLTAGGFEILAIEHLFVFPRFLRWFRPLEPKMAHLPIGAQYQVLCKKPMAGGGQATVARAAR